MKDFLALLGFLLASAATAAIGGLAPSAAGYVELRQPFFAPPSWLFGPVWTLLYVLMAVAAWLVWRERKKTKVKVALFFYFAQLALNALWTLIFFLWMARFWAVVEIIILFVFIFVTTLFFGRIKKASAYLMIPYMAWVIFATVLASAVWYLNR